MIYIYIYNANMNQNKTLVCDILIKTLLSNCDIHYDSRFRSSLVYKLMTQKQLVISKIAL